MRTLRLYLLLISVLVCIASTAYTQGGVAQGRYKPSELVLKLESGRSVDSINAKYGTQTKGHQLATDVYLLRVPVGRDIELLAEQIAAETGVVYCQPNFYLMAPEGLQRSSPFLDQQARSSVELQPAAFDLHLSETQLIATGTSVTVALIDGGVDIDHPWFSRQPGPIRFRWDFVDDDSLAFDEPGGSCTGHGTFVAGILHLVAPGTAINVYRVLDTAGFGDGYSISNAVLMAIADSVEVINLSLGMSGTHDGLDEALKLARQQGILIVASAGNDSTDLASLFPFPASRDYCIAVAALDSVNRKADFSNYGTKVDLCAPGTWLYGPYPDSIYAWWDGTSFATPFVAALAALGRSVDSSLSMLEIDGLLQLTATRVDSLNPGYEDLLGFGLINPKAFIDEIAPVTRGDWTNDGVINLSDLSSMIFFLTFAGLPPEPISRGDVTCDNQIDLSDLSRLAAFLEGLDVTLCTSR